MTRDAHMSIDTFFETALQLSTLALVWALYLVRQRRFKREGIRPRWRFRVRHADVRLEPRRTIARDAHVA